MNIITLKIIFLISFCCQFRHIYSANRGSCYPPLEPRCRANRGLLDGTSPLKIKILEIQVLLMNKNSCHLYQFSVFRSSNSSFDNFSQLHSSQNKRIFENILGVLSRIWNRIFWGFFEHKIPGSSNHQRLLKIRYEDKIELLLKIPRGGV